MSCRPYVPSNQERESNSDDKTRATRDPLRNENGPLFGQLLSSGEPAIYFSAWISPDNSNSTLTTGFTFNKKLLGSLMPHFT
jgi:hypothetical protein